MVISIFKFLSRYYGITLNAAVQCTHLNAKQNFKFIKSCSTWFASNNQELVNKGKIIYVRDTHGDVKPYFCPSVIISSYEECSYDSESSLSDEFDFDIDNVLNRLGNISTYEVRELLGKYKKNNMFYRLIKKELIYRGIYSNKKYKINKEMNKIMESDYSDQYKRSRKIKY